jgi:hypothetical protein
MLAGRMVWFGMSRGRFVGGRNVKAPNSGRGNVAYSGDSVPLNNFLVPKKLFYVFLN